MISKFFIILFIGVLPPLVSHSQIKESEEVDSTIIKIQQQLNEQTVDSLYESYSVADSVLEMFLKVHPEFNNLFNQEDSLTIPFVTFKMLDTSVVRIKFSWNYMKSESYYLINECLVKTESNYQKYIGPTAMSTCSGLYKSSYITYYQNNVSIKTFSSEDPCFMNGNIDLVGFYYSPEPLKRMLDFIHTLQIYILI
ncbi:hypothetical protein [Fluviicola taffensis]|uniref:hypothetical protein n=1 Tax=Fluviicola taffensis TaxID=191579 RepID=UPI003137E3A3